MKIIRSLFVCLSLSSTIASAHGTDQGQQPRKLISESTVAVTAGTTGVGFELGVPMHDMLRLRAGATFMPKFRHNMVFTAQVGDDEKVQYDKDGNRLPTRFEKMADMLEGFVGQPVDDKVNMYAVPHLNQFKMMVDVFPFHSKNWYFTAGFFVGKSRVAHAVNNTNETSSLFAINLYNRLYENEGEIILGFSVPPEYLIRILTYGKAGFHTGDYVDSQKYYNEDWEEWVVGHEKGDAYMMTPNSDNQVYADAFVTRFRPYFGFGYEGALSKDNRWKLGFDAGVMFWGGAPSLIDHSGTDLIYDIENVNGQVGKYINLVRHSKAFPILEIKLTRRIF